MDENSPILNGISFWLLCLFYFLPLSNGYGTGAGLRACTDLRPGHGSPNTGPSPYTIQVLNGVTTYTPGTPVAGIHHHESLTNWTLSFCQGVDYSNKLVHFVHFGLSHDSFAILTILAHFMYL